MLVEFIIKKEGQETFSIKTDITQEEYEEIRNKLQDMASSMDDDPNTMAT